MSRMLRVDPHAIDTQNVVRNEDRRLFDDTINIQTATYFMDPFSKNARVGIPTQQS